MDGGTQLGMPGAPVIMVVVLLTMIAFYATSFDSIALTASCYSYHTLEDGEQPNKGIQLMWCILLILLPIALLFAESSMNNLQSVSIVAAFCKKCGEKLACHWQSDGALYFYCASCHVSISEKDLWNGINKELHQRMEEHRDLQKLVRKSSGKSKLQSKEIATKREIEQASGNIVRLESQKRSGYEQYVLGKFSKEKFLELKQGFKCFIC